jgi:hypothetical protein
LSDDADAHSSADPATARRPRRREERRQLDGFPDVEFVAREFDRLQLPPRVGIDRLAGRDQRRMEDSRRLFPREELDRSPAILGESSRWTPPEASKAVSCVTEGVPRRCCSTGASKATAFPLPAFSVGIPNLHAFGWDPTSTYVTSRRTAAGANVPLAAGAERARTRISC